MNEFLKGVSLANNTIESDRRDAQVKLANYIKG